MNVPKGVKKRRKKAEYVPVEERPQREFRMPVSGTVNCGGGRRRQLKKAKY